MTSPITFNLLQFDANTILFRHNQTHQIYQYTQTYRQLDFPVDSPIIIMSYPLANGWVYQRELTTLAKQVRPKITLAQQKAQEYFQEAELNNTFETILQFLQLGGKHGAINLQNILIDEQGSIRLKDPRLCSFENEPNKDYQNLGLIILQCALLKNEEQVSKIERSKCYLANELKRYSTKFITNLWILLEGSQELKSKVDFTDSQAVDLTYKRHYDEIESLRKASFAEITSKIDVFKSIQQKKVTVPALNLKFSKTKQGKNTKLNFSGKKRTTQDQNENEQSLPKQSCLPGKLQQKIGSKNQEMKFKPRKLEVIENLRTPLKRRGKTSEKKNEQGQVSQF